MQAGVPTELHIYRGCYHGSDIFAPDADAHAVDRVRASVSLHNGHAVNRLRVLTRALHGKSR